jgi:hypothetical protein
MAKEGNQVVLVISDTHVPYNHKDLIRFLSAVHERYKPTRVVHIGDEIDGHALSFHEHDPDLLSAGCELNLARAGLKALFRLFPCVDVLESNHGSLVYRRARASGIPNGAIRSYREVIDAPEGWKWHPELILRLPDSSLVTFRHGISKNNLNWSKTLATHTVNGHYHEDFNIRYWRTPRGLHWSMVVGCLIDDASLAFAYNKLFVHRPILGVGLIINSHPVLVPMICNRAGRWVGVLP